MTLLQANFPIFVMPNVWPRPGTVSLVQRISCTQVGRNFTDAYAGFIGEINSKITL